MKREHEDWGRLLPGPPQVRIRRDRTVESVRLHLVDSGRDLMAFVAGFHAAEILTPELADAGEAELVGGLLQGVQDWGEIWPEVDVTGRLRAEVDLTTGIMELRDAGFIVYCGRRQDTIEGGVGGPSPWHVLIVEVFRTDDPRLAPDKELASNKLTADQEYWREQIVSQTYPLIGRVETYGDFEIDTEIRSVVAQYARTMRGAVKGKFRDLAAALPSDEEEERVLGIGTRGELIGLLKTYARLFG